MKKSGGMDLHKGLTNCSPKSVDKSMSIPKGTTVNEGTRDSVAKTPGTLGPRVA